MQGSRTGRRGGGGSFKHLAPTPRQTHTHTLSEHPECQQKVRALKTCFTEVLWPLVSHWRTLQGDDMMPCKTQLQINARYAQMSGLPILTDYAIVVFCLFSFSPPKVQLTVMPLILLSHSHLKKNKKTIDPTASVADQGPYEARCETPQAARGLAMPC